MQFVKKHEKIIAFLLLIIITIPSFISIINGEYFSMHDDQHVARLFLLDQGIRQGNFFPRWVDGLGFGYGYPLFNFYPPLIYYVAEFFHLIGFSLFLSIKLTFILGFILAAFGSYLLAKNIIGRLPALLAAVLYTYFSYHAVNAYVRGALAEFFGMAIIPFVFLNLESLFRNKNKLSIVFFAVTFGLLMLTHPLVSFPSLFYIVFFAIFYFLISKDNGQRLLFFIDLLKAGLLGLSFSAFFWLPSFFEKKFTLVDDILTKELANYKLHYIFPSQFWYSPWGFGGSLADRFDGMSFQLGKIHIFLFILSVIVCLLFKKWRRQEKLSYFFFFVFLSIFSLFMTVNYSSFIWDGVRYLWYLQFPWRFLTFAGLFISLCGAFAVIFIAKLFKDSFSKIINVILVVIISLSTVFLYKKYFKPQEQFATNDKILTSFEEISWKISKSSFEFVPKGTATKKTELNTSTLDIEKKDLPQATFELLSGRGNIKLIKDNFVKKEYSIDIKSSATMRLNTYYFPGWKAYLNGKELTISDDNRLKLITINLPSNSKGQLKFIFRNTPIRTIADLTSFISLLILGYLLIPLKKTKKNKLSLKQPV